MCATKQGRQWWKNQTTLIAQHKTQDDKSKRKLHVWWHVMQNEDATQLNILKYCPEFESQTPRTVLPRRQNISQKNCRNPSKSNKKDRDTQSNVNSTSLTVITKTHKPPSKCPPPPPPYTPAWATWLPRQSHNDWWQRWLFMAQTSDLEQCSNRLQLDLLMNAWVNLCSLMWIGDQM